MLDVAELAVLLRFGSLGEGQFSGVSAGAHHV